jgi:hypothetical protein
MSGLTFTPDPSSSLPDTALDAAEVGPHIAGGTVDFAAPPAAGSIAFVLGVGANAAIFLFNSPDDEDPDGVLGHPPIALPGFDHLVQPPGIALSPDRAWLKYRVSATAKVSASGALAPVAAKVDGKAGVVFADYHVHGRAERLRQAVASTITGRGLRIFARPEDAFDLQPHEALVYQLRGELTGSLTLSWADVLGTAGVSLARLVAPGETLGLAVSAGASVAFDVGLVDVFKVIVTRGDARDVRVAVARGSSRDLGVAAAAGVMAKFSDEQAARSILQRLYEAVAGRPAAAVDAALAKASLESLSTAERKVVEHLVGRLGLGEIAPTLETVRAHWAALKTRIEGLLFEVARSKVTLGFAYEYRRTTTEDTLFAVELSRDDYRRFHGDLLVCELRPVLAWLGEPAHAPALVSYLHQKTLKRSQAWGFTLGIGPWQIQGRDREELGTVVQTTRRGETTLERHAYLGLRGYKAAVFGNSCEWAVDFRADQPEFLEAERATAADFEYGLHLGLRWKEKTLSKGELREFLDYAVIWRVVGSRGAREIEAELQDTARKKKAEVSVSLTIPNDAFTKMLTLLGSASIDDLGARALAKAMPYLEEYDARRHPVVREACYAPLWRYYLANPSLPIDAYGPIAERAIRRMTELDDEAALARREGGVWSGRPAYQDLYTFAGQIYSNGSTVHGDYGSVAARWRAHAGALRRLGRAIDQREPHTVVKDVFKALAPFWSQWLFVRAAAAWSRAAAVSPADAKALAALWLPEPCALSREPWTELRARAQIASSIVTASTTPWHP